MCLIYNPDAAAVLLPRGHTAAAVADPRHALGSFCIVVDVPPVPLATEGSKAQHAWCTVRQASGGGVRSHLDHLLCVECSSATT